MAFRASLALAAVALAGLTLAVAVAGCGSDDNEAATTAAETTTVTAPSEDDTPATKVSANTATREELTEAFEAAGIPSAEKWAEEVEEYRPYPVDDANWTHLRTELAKYNPPPEVLEKIIALLEP